MYLTWARTYSGFGGMAERREASVKGSGLLETSKSPERKKQDEDVVRSRGKEKSRERRDKKREEFSSPGTGTPGLIAQSRINLIKNASASSATLTRSRRF